MNVLGGYSIAVVKSVKGVEPLLILHLAEAGCSQGCVAIPCTYRTVLVIQFTDLVRD